jgi:2-phospho-L-lactate guanylyltransferase
MSGLWIVIPVKDTRFSKQRLADVLSAGERQALAHAMLEDVLDAVVAMREVVGVALVSVDQFAVSLARRHGFRIIEEGAHDGHMGAVDGGRRVLAGEGAGGILTMPGDIPLVTATEIGEVVGALRFGADSFYPHLDAARLAGIEPRVMEFAGIATDVDTPEDADRLLRADAGRRSRAARLLEDFQWTARRAAGPMASAGIGS